MIERAIWPGGARMALALTFDFDAESLWLAADPANRERLVTLSIGAYGARVGVPRILDLLAAEGLRATFFTPGWTAERYPERLEAIVAAGHEVGHHGHLHRRPDPADEAGMVEEMTRGLEALARVAGVRPKGYRAPGGESCEFLLRLLVAEGFVYQSSMRSDDRPYRHRLADGSPGPVEVPEQPELDDWNFGATHLRDPQPLYPKAAVLAIWQETFRGLYERGGAATVVMHPQVTARPMRLAILRDFIAFTRTFEGVWYATAGEVAEAFVAAEGA